MKKDFVTLVVMILLCVYIPGVARSEQTVSLPGHYALSEIGAVSFPSSAVRIVGSVLDVEGAEGPLRGRPLEPFHVICVNLGDGSLECVSTLESQSLYITGYLDDSCFAAKSADPRFVIATPVLGDNTCILNANITRTPGMFERTFNPEVVEDVKVSRWSVDAPRKVKRVNAYERVVEIMKRNRVDFKNQILTVDDLPMSFRDFQDMIVSDITGTKHGSVGPLDQLADDLKTVNHMLQTFEKNVKSMDWERIFFPLNKHYNEFARGVNGFILNIESTIRWVPITINGMWMKACNVLTVNGLIPFEAYTNNPIIFVMFIAMILMMSMMVVNTVRFFLMWAKPLMAVFWFVFVFYLLVK
jgi:hypothetical protein